MNVNSRSWEIHPPDDAEVLATTDGAVQLFRIGRSVGTQFHPEIDVAQLTRWLSASDDEYLRTLGSTRQALMADAISHEMHNTKQCHALVDWWLDKVAAAKHIEGSGRTRRAG